jgi:hypothetical protein
MLAMIANEDYNTAMSTFLAITTLKIPARV